MRRLQLVYGLLQIGSVAAGEVNHRADILAIHNSETFFSSGGKVEISRTIQGAGVSDMRMHINDRERRTRDLSLGRMQHAARLETLDRQDLLLTFRLVRESEFRSEDCGCADGAKEVSSIHEN